MQYKSKKIMDSINKYTVGVVILNYASYVDTIRLVKELQYQSISKKLQIIIVDNCSPNESYDKLKKLPKCYDNVVVLQTEENLGYAKGNNYGLQYLEENGNPDYVTILNNDVILPNDCFERLIERYKQLDKAAVIAPMMTDADGNRQVVMGNLGSTWNDFKILFAVYNKLAKNNALKECDNTGLNAMRVEVISGSFMFARLRIFKEMGYFYPNTFLYVEERFVAEAAKKLGYHNYVLLDQTYIHAHNSPTISIYHNQISKYEMLYASRLEYIRVCKKFGSLKAAILRPFMWWSLIEWRIIYWLKKRNNHDNN